MASLFSQIISGKIPSHKVYEDDSVFAFLDIYPVQPGHLLVIPKAEVDHLEDLSEQDYIALLLAVRKLMHKAREVMGTSRACLKVEGFDVPHAHIHIIPCNTAAEFYTQPDRSKEPDHQALAVIAERFQ
jgi:histidine triad (HIT) family protein